MYESSEKSEKKGRDAVINPIGLEYGPPQNTANGAVAGKGVFLL